MKFLLFISSRPTTKSAWIFIYSIRVNCLLLLFNVPSIKNSFDFPRFLFLFGYKIYLFHLPCRQSIKDSSTLLISFIEKFLVSCLLLLEFLATHFHVDKDLSRFINIIWGNSVTKSYSLLLKTPNYWKNIWRSFKNKNISMFFCNLVCGVARIHYL